HGLNVFDVHRLPTHGGSLRLFAAHREDAKKTVSAEIQALREEEALFGIADLETHRDFSEQVKHTKRKLLEFLVSAKAAGKSIVGYGAPAKGNTLPTSGGHTSTFTTHTVGGTHH